MIRQDKMIYKKRRSTKLFLRARPFFLCGRICPSGGPQDIVKTTERADQLNTIKKPSRHPWRHLHSCREGDQDYIYGLFQRLRKVIDDILHILDSHGKADQIRTDAAGDQLLVGELAVR